MKTVLLMIAVGLAVLFGGVFIGKVIRLSIEQKRNP